MKDRRATHRVQQHATGLRVRLERDGDTWDGNVVDTSHGGVAVAYPIGAAPQLKLGERLEIVFHGGGIGEGKQVFA